jgi:PAS domain S-box-containing protein
MPKIALITSDPDFFEQAGRICKELELQREIDLYLTHLAEAVHLAEKLQHEGVDVIIARGGLAMLILAAGINIPLVEVVITGQDLARIFLDAREITGLERPKAAFIAFDNMVADVEIIARITNVDLTIYRLQTNEDIPVMVDAVADREHDVILGGTRTVALARKRGLRATLLQSGPLSTKNAILEAKKIAQGRQIEKEESGKFKALIDFSLEGIISVDSNKRIQIINPAAQRLLNCSTRDLRGQPVSALLDLPEIDRCIKAGNEIRGHVMQLDNTWLSLNLGPIIVNQTPIGAFITFQEISRIQEAEATIRNEVLARKFQAKYTLADILGRSPQIVEAKRIAAEIARTDATTLIIGESGTGKELFAQGIHNLSDRRHGPFVAINCAALPPNLLESELFGYVEGAFTGATKKGKPGLFEMAHRGTLFLDEISEMDKYGQSRLLRVLQEKQIMRLGGEKNIPVDVRIIAACNRNLSQLIEARQFRQDLY